MTKKTLQWVLSGLTDASVTDDYNFDIAFPEEARAQLVELARTEYTPRQVAVIRSGLDEGLVQSIVQVLTALEIRMAVRKLNVNLAEKGEIFRVGVGINTGMALAGAVGPMERQEYTVVGNTVNLAARIDGLNKQFPEHDILISPWTFDALGEHRAKVQSGLAWICANTREERSCGDLGGSGEGVENSRSQLIQTEYR